MKRFAQPRTVALPHRPASGYTLFELMVVFALIAVGVSALVPAARRFADGVHVLEAREAVARGLLRGRAAGVSAGGSVVTVTTAPARIRVAAGGSTVYDAPVGDGRTDLVLARSRDSLVLRFDGLGIGRFTSATLSIRRGEASAGLVLSSYGRVRRR